MDKVYDAFIDDYIDRENMELNAPPERYMEITTDLLNVMMAEDTPSVLK